MLELLFFQRKKGEDPAEEQKRLIELSNSIRSVASDFTTTLEIRAVDQNNEIFLHVTAEKETVL